jgi:cell division protein ZapE
LNQPSKVYRQLTQAGEFQNDEYQLQALPHLDRFFNDYFKPAAKSSFLFPSKKPLIKGLYLWGGVGRGKTWIMDLLYDCLQTDKKRRQHFHAFMQDVHCWLKEYSGKKDPLPFIASKLSRQLDVLFLDEFHVVDIADAMILAQLLKGMFLSGIALVTTSNRLPENLYNEGIQRASFLPAIKLLETETEVIHVGGGHDYRREILEQLPVYFLISGLSADEQFLNEFNELTRNQEIKTGGSLDIANRALYFKRKGLDVIWFSFGQLCNGPRHASDYLEIASSFQTVFLDDVPSLDGSKDDCVRRFISMIDIFYDHRIKLLISAAVRPEKLYSGERLAFEFTRTVSRLLEMQSSEYLSLAHEP